MDGDRFSRSRRLALAGLLSVVGISLLLNSFATWFELGNFEGVGHPFRWASGNAWQASSEWAWAISLGLAAVTLGVLAALFAGTRLASRMLLAATAMTAIAVGLWTRQWVLTRPPLLPRYAYAYISGPPVSTHVQTAFATARLQRDQLASYVRNSEGRTLLPDLIGLALLIALALVLLIGFASIRQGDVRSED